MIVRQRRHDDFGQACFRNPFRIRCTSAACGAKARACMSTDIRPIPRRRPPSPCCPSEYAHSERIVRTAAQYCRALLSTTPARDRALCTLFDDDQFRTRSAGPRSRPPSSKRRSCACLSEAGAGKTISPTDVGPRADVVAGLAPADADGAARRDQARARRPDRHHPQGQAGRPERLQGRLPAGPAAAGLERRPDAASRSSPRRCKGLGTAGRAAGSPLRGHRRCRSCAAQLRAPIRRSVLRESRNRSCGPQRAPIDRIGFDRKARGAEVADRPRHVRGRRHQQPALAGLRVDQRALW